ncbi:MAG: hypothetical protein DWQ05_16355 [Calditrichaeota bacterium]|nr:MAG: hypothetical protein DWQ05_16355 [Calditrichota bacterium]
MKPNKNAVLLIIISIVFAALMILVSYILNGSPYGQHAETVNFLLIALWFIPFNLLSSRRKKCARKTL